MVIGGCCSSACSTALGTVDVMGCGLLARKMSERGRGRGSAEGPVQGGAAVPQIRVVLAGGGEEHGVRVGDHQFLAASRPSTGGPVGSGEGGEPRELPLALVADPVDV